MEFIKVSEKTPENYRRVEFIKMYADGYKKIISGLYHDGFIWCSLKVNNVIAWRYR